LDYKKRRITIKNKLPKPEVIITGVQADWQKKFKKPRDEHDAPRKTKRRVIKEFDKKNYFDVEAFEHILKFQEMSKRLDEAPDDKELRRACDKYYKDNIHTTLKRLIRGSWTRHASAITSKRNYGELKRDEIADGFADCIRAIKLFKVLKPMETPEEKKIVARQCFNFLTKISKHSFFSAWKKLSMMTERYEYGLYEDLHDDYFKLSNHEDFIDRNDPETALIRDEEEAQRGYVTTFGKTLKEKSDFIRELKDDTLGWDKKEIILTVLDAVCSFDQNIELLIDCRNMKEVINVINRMTTLSPILIKRAIKFICECPTSFTDGPLPKFNHLLRVTDLRVKE
jgi:hypothetical protein